MITRDTPALLVAGNRIEFIETAVDCTQYLINEAGFNPIKIWTHCDLTSNEETVERIGSFFQRINAENPEQDAVMIYFGHGLNGGFYPCSENNPIYYDRLAELITHKGNILFINYSCYSESCIPPFRDSGILPNRGSVIASADSTELSKGKVFHRSLLNAFRQRKPYREREIETEPEKKLLTHEIQKLMVNPLTEKWEPVGEKIPEYLIFPAIYQHPQRCGLDLDHLLFPQ